MQQTKCKKIQILQDNKNDDKNYNMKMDFDLLTA